MEKLVKLVIEWADNKGLLTNITPERIEAQTLKVLEEIGETSGALLKSNTDDLIDGIGDIAVTLIILSAMKDHEIEFVEFEKEGQHLLLSVTECLIFYNQDDDVNYLNNSMTHLSLFAESKGLFLIDCLQSAYDVISKRTGKMVGDTFVKD